MQVEPAETLLNSSLARIPYMALHPRSGHTPALKFAPEIPLTLTGGPSPVLCRILPTKKTPRELESLSPMIQLPRSIYPYLILASCMNRRGTVKTRFQHRSILPLPKPRRHPPFPIVL